MRIRQALVYDGCRNCARWIYRTRMEERGREYVDCVTNSAFGTSMYKRAFPRVKRYTMSVSARQAPRRSFARALSGSRSGLDTRGVNSEWPKLTRSVCPTEPVF